MADWKSGEPQIMEPDKVERWDWYEMDKLPKPLFRTIPTYFEAYKTGKNFTLPFCYTLFMQISIGQKAPEWKLKDQNGVEHTSRDAFGSWLVLYFYPKDDTPGCTKEACVFRDNLPTFGKINAQVFGVSIDSVKKHAKFAQKYNLPFTLLADEDKELVQAYGVWAKKKFMGREYMGILRTTFLIDPGGKIAKIYENVKPETHADEILSDLKKLQAT